MSLDKLPKNQQKYQERLQHSKRKKRGKQAVNIISIVVGVGVLILALYPITNLTEPIQRLHPFADGNSLGDPNAPILLEVYSDFKCPACEFFYTTVEPQLIQNYVATGIVQYVFHTFGDRLNPPESGLTAQAVYCAEDQGKFWEMHNYIFTNFDYGTTKGFTDKILVTMAELIGIDENIFSECLANEVHAEDIINDVEEGRALGIPGTPSVIINGTLLDGFQYAEIEEAIENIIAGEIPED